MRRVLRFKPPEVCRYDPDGLALLLQKASGAPLDVVRDKPQVSYLAEYLASINARTVVVERDYVDRDFLEDYAGFYVRCFHTYGSRCVRLHFFDQGFTKTAFLTFLANPLQHDLKSVLEEGYLGFVVVKPLPEAIIGRTCLATQSEKEGSHFPITRSYSAHLFGTKLEVRKTLAFQEQDTVAAACATTALWSAFQGTGKLFQHPIPPPVEITKAALSRFPMDERDLPSLGLNVWQMAHGIRSVGLEPYRVRVNDDYSDVGLMQSTVYAYLRGGIPVLLAMQLYDMSGPPKPLGPHAVAITGFSIRSSTPVPYGPTGLLLLSSRIDNLYVHDDGVGPFARMSFDRSAVSYTRDGAGCIFAQKGPPLLTTCWRGRNGQVGHVYALPDVLLIPLYHKIRIPFSSVMGAVIAFDDYVEQNLRQRVLGLSERIEWDVFLTGVDDIKAQLGEAEFLVPEYRKEALVEPMPRFIWCATARCAGQKVLDLLFDATDVERGPFFVRAMEYDPVTSYVLRVIAKEPAIVERPRTHALWKALQWFADQPTPDV